MKRIIVVTTVVVALFTIGLLLVQADSNGGLDEINQSLAAFIQPNITYKVFVTEARLEGVNRTAVFDFMVCPINDPVWWLMAGGIYAVYQTEGEGCHEGASFDESINAGPLGEWTTHVTLDVHNRPRYAIQRNDGPVQTWSLIIVPAGQSSAFRSYSIMNEHELLTYAQLELQLTFAYQAAAAYLGTTVEASVVPLGPTGSVTSGPNGEIDLPFDIEELIRANDAT